MRMCLSLSPAIALALLLLAGGATMAQDNCPALRKQQDEECRSLAERRQELCPSGEGAECRRLSEQIAGKCTRNPCLAPDTGGKPKPKRRPKGKKG
jgi:uncharacterized membrane protein